MKVFKLLLTNLAIFSLNGSILLLATLVNPGVNPVEPVSEFNEGALKYTEYTVSRQPAPTPKPTNEKPTQKPTQVFAATLYAYSSTPDQTNGDPFITASGLRVTDGIIANNCLPFGSKVKIHDKMYEVQDRMAARYGCSSFDVWHPTRESAIQFGKQTATVEVY